MQTAVMRLLTLALALASPAAAAASFVYEGRLDEFGQPANGRYDLKLTAYGHEAQGATLAAPISFEGVEVRDGRFRLDVDLPLVKADQVWLEVAVRGSGELEFARIPSRSKAIAAPLIGACWSTIGDSGSNPNTNFLGTTDGQPLVLRSTAGVGINTSGVRGMLTVRGPDDFQNGPVIHLAGNDPTQFESGRIRFVNGTTPGNFRGFYLHYDGTGNFFHIGGRDSTDSAPSGDRNIITIRRSAPNRVGIGNPAPSEALDVAGNIALTGNIKFGLPSSTHFLSFPASAFSELAQNVGSQTACIGADDGISKIQFSPNACRARLAVHLPQGALVRRVSARVRDVDGSVCGVNLRRIDLLAGEAPVTTIASALSTAAFNGGFTTVTSPIASHTVDNSSRALMLQAFSDGDFCRIAGAIIEYDLPDGFRP
jgi:hypothetical protein